MKLYASQTHGRRNLEALRKNGFSLLVTPDTFRDTTPLWDNGEPAPYALDNGAWGCDRRGEPFNWEAFRRMVLRLGSEADWVIAPDIVGGGRESLEISVKWRETYPASSAVLIAVQNGMSADDVRPHLGKNTGIAVGGTTEFKHRTLPIWSRLAREVDCHLHVLRVNTRRRLAACDLAGAHSVDGTSATVFSCNAPLLRRWVDELTAQQTLGVWK